jgi:hypothetical protein
VVVVLCTVEVGMFGELRRPSSVRLVAKGSRYFSDPTLPTWFLQQGLKNQF